MHHTREIPREVWSDYLTLLSGMNRSQWVRIEAASIDIGEQPLAQRLPLIDISYVEKGSGRDAIEVTVGRPGEEITHRIFHPERIYADESESGELECLDIEDTGRTKTIIFFEPMQAIDTVSDTQPQA
ncbi:DUF5335 family protein [Hyalangium minutum]|uniref:Uncharacterized protein n=1 Tax=Hyalangium minutum TaxID=394096 RepID=A0A085WJU8_9BACT|nr:DUF5335 family protein [Hyalangium minutum]KFE67961.1 hypothetical protein DB31_7198 [Hyalangium minutum]